MKNHLLIAITVLALGIAGCATKHPAPTAPAAAVPAEGAAAPGASTSGLAGSPASVGAVDAGGEGVSGPQAGLLAKRIVYFDFDRAEIRPDATELVAAHARYLAGHASAKVRLEGHTDERGTREYNIGLGERRAQAVRHALLLQGVAESQLSTVSYGEERPAAAGHDESAWSLNRRVEIVYLTQ